MVARGKRGGRGRGWGETLERDMRKVLGFMDVFITLIVRMVSWGKHTAKLIKLYILCHFWYIILASIRAVKTEAT